MRVGHGFDAHRLEPGKPLVLGGVHVPGVDGLKAHSDGDVLLHALCDAMLGAAGLGDIGAHFPDSSDEFSGIDSRVLLRRVAAELRRKGLRVVNADVTVIAERPRLREHVPLMQARIAADLGVDDDAVNVKATTTEGLDYTGGRPDGTPQEGIAAHAVVLVDAAPS